MLCTYIHTQIMHPAADSSAGLSTLHSDGLTAALTPSGLGSKHPAHRGSEQRCMHLRTGSVSPWRHACRGDTRLSESSALDEVGCAHDAQGP